MLVAEDNPINQAILRDQLEQLGCHAVVASDGNEALRYWPQRPFALVLTDLNMPGLDGYGLARALRARGVGVPIHGATANADPAERQRCHEAGMQGVLVKPITLAALQRLLSQVAAQPHSEPIDDRADAQHHVRIRLDQFAIDLAEQVAGEVAAIGELDDRRPAARAGANDVQADLGVGVVEDRAHALGLKRLKHADAIMGHGRVPLR